MSNDMEKIRFTATIQPLYVIRALQHSNCLFFNILTHFWTMRQLQNALWKIWVHGKIEWKNEFHEKKLTKNPFMELFASISNRTENPQ